MPLFVRTITALAAAAAVCAASSTADLRAQRSGAPAGALKTLTRVDDLRTAFNRDAGNIRIILLLSPT